MVHGVCTSEMSQTERKHGEIAGRARRTQANLRPGETLPDPVEIVQNELARIEARTDVLKIAPDDEVVAEIYRAQTVLARTPHMNRQLIQMLFAQG